jgi:hypothetical protein
MWLALLWLYSPMLMVIVLLSLRALRRKTPAPPMDVEAQLIAAVIFIVIVGIFSCTIKIEGNNDQDNLSLFVLALFLFLPQHLAGAFLFIARRRTLVSLATTALAGSALTCGAACTILVNLPRLGIR